MHVFYINRWLLRLVIHCMEWRIVPIDILLFCTICIYLLYAWDVCTWKLGVIWDKHSKSPTNNTNRRCIKIGMWFVAGPYRSCTFSPCAADSGWDKAAGEVAEQCLGCRQEPGFACPAHRHLSSPAEPHGDALRGVWGAGEPCEPAKIQRWGNPAAGLGCAAGTCGQRGLHEQRLRLPVHLRAEPCPARPQQGHRLHGTNSPRNRAAGWCRQRSK